MKNILFIYAHLDDETILSYGTMMKFAKDCSIHVAIICGEGRNVTTEQNITIQKTRIAAFAQNCSQFTYTLLPYKDITLTADIVKKEVKNIIDMFKPDVVFSHLSDDFHYEHRLVADEVLLSCRRQKNCNVKALYASVSPAMMQKYGQKDKAFLPNYFIDITDYIEQKNIALSRYSMELPSDANDIRSAESIIAQNRQYGRLMNTGYCEAYQQIFKLA